MAPATAFSFPELEIGAENVSELLNFSLPPFSVFSKGFRSKISGGASEREKSALFCWESQTEPWERNYIGT